MADYIFKGKRRLGYTDIADFTDIQGIGRDPLYRRYDSVFSVVKTAIKPEFQHFLAVPQYLEEEGQICWHINEWSETPAKLTALSGAKREKYDAIKQETICHYQEATKNLSGEALQILSSAIKYVDDERIYCADDKVYVVAWGMTPDEMHKVVGSVFHEYSFVQNFKLTFEPGEHGSFATKIDKYLTKAKGYTLKSADIPKVLCNDGWEFVAWEPSPIDYVVNEDATFTATYKKVEVEPPIVPLEPEPQERYYNCAFDAGAHGTIDGMESIRKVANSSIDEKEIPNVKPKKGYKFTGWNITPANCIVDGDKTFVAQYKKTIPWYKRWWLWLVGLFAGKGCLKWLLWLLLILLILWIISHFHLLESCHREPVVPIETIHDQDGKEIDDNGQVRPIGGEDGALPDDNMIVAPVMGEGGEEPPIIRQPGAPAIIANRLFLFLEDDNDDIEALARDFKHVYPGEQYAIIGYDKEVKYLVIQIPESERVEIRETLPSKIPDHKFIVFDEEVYELNGDASGSEDVGWHLNAIHLKQGWNYTMGSPDVRVAVVDDGIQGDHPMFKGRIVDAYNVFTQNNHLSSGEGHGTHTAGLAAGSDEFYDKGASGVAPKCRLMPIQVFDNNKCPLSALIAGVMYAIHHDADVVNISIGPSFDLNKLPIEEQKIIAKTEFQNVAILWDRVCKLAAKKKSILVFAAGNDHILASIPPENRNESSVVVTAVDKRMYPTVFTNYGDCSDISAPGKDIYSSFPVNRFQSFDGTSMAAPIVSGTIALMKSIKKDLTVEQARNVLYATGADVYGWIPPMVLVDRALATTQKGDFSRGPTREITPLPDDKEADGPGQPIVGGDDIISNPIDENPPVDSGGSVGIGDGGNSGGDDGGRIIVPPNDERNDGELDYDAILRLIEYYKKKIEELENLLPKKK